MNNEKSLINDKNTKIGKNSSIISKDIVSKNMFKSIFGQEGAKRDMMSALLTDRHMIIIGPPGVGKTTLAKDIALHLEDIELNDCDYHCTPDSPVCPACRNATEKVKTRIVRGMERFVRIQGSPDLVVEDLLGDIDPIVAMKKGPIKAFTPGKLFKANNGILFFDELNRCPEKLQNALLQVLEEGRATIGSYDVDIDANFIFIATMNPDDFAGTEKLSEVLLDRFDLAYMDYPETIDIETKIVKGKGKHLLEFPDDVLKFSLEFIRHLRNSDNLEKVPSVRASIGLYERAQGLAVINAHKRVGVDDVVNSMLSVLGHRIRLKPSSKYLMSTTEFIKSELKEFSKNKDIEFSFEHDNSGSEQDQGDSP